MNLLSLRKSVSWTGADSQVSKNTGGLVSWSMRSDRMSVTSEEVPSHCVWFTECVSWCPMSDLPLCPLSITPVSSDTSLLLLSFFFCNRRVNRAGGLSHTESLQRGTPCSACKSPLSYIHTHIHGDPVSACLALHRIVISHQADQRTTPGSERTLTRGSPSGWQAIAHPQLTERHTLHLTAASASGSRSKCGWFHDENLSLGGQTTPTEASSHHPRIHLYVNPVLHYSI